MPIKNALTRVATNMFTEYCAINKSLSECPAPANNPENKSTLKGGLNTMPNPIPAIAEKI